MLGGVGAQEFIILLIIVVLLFGVPLLTFLLGYNVGRKSSVPPAARTRRDDESREQSE